MASGKWKVYDLAKYRLGNLTLDLTAPTNWYIALFSSISNANTLSVGTGVYGDLTNELPTAFGYTLGGVALTGVTWTNVGGIETFTCVSPSWTASGGSLVYRYAVIYKNATVNGIVKPLLCVSVADTTPADSTTTAGNQLIISINAAGVFTLSGATID